MDFQRQEMESQRKLFVQYNMLTENGQELPLILTDITWERRLETFIAIYPIHVSCGIADLRRDYHKNATFYDIRETLRFHQSPEPVGRQPSEPNLVPARAPTEVSSDSSDSSRTPTPSSTQTPTQIFHPDTAEFALQKMFAHYRPSQVTKAPNSHRLWPFRSYGETVQHAPWESVEELQPNQVSTSPRATAQARNLDDTAEYALRKSIEERRLSEVDRTPRAEILRRDHADVLSATRDTAEFAADIDAANVLLIMHADDAQMPARLEQ
jgi:hypothetical protein